MKNVSITAAIFSLTLIGCGGGSDNGSSPRDALVNATATPQTAPMVNFAKVIVPLYVGSYPSEFCSRATLPGSAIAIDIATQTLNVATDGTISMWGESANLFDKTAILYTRKLDESGPLSVVIDNIATSFDRVMPRFEIVGGRFESSVGVLNFRPGSEVLVSCKSSASASALAAKPIYPVIEKFVATSQIPLRCAANGGIVGATYQLLDGNVKFNEEVYPLGSGLAEESIYVTPDTSKAATENSATTYSTKALDGRGFQLLLDSFGRTISVLYTSSTGAVSSCSPK